MPKTRKAADTAQLKRRLREELRRESRKTTDIVSLNLRLIKELRHKHQREHATKKHSLNTEIVERLQASLAAQADSNLVERIIKALAQQSGMLEKMKAPIRGLIDTCYRDADPALVDPIASD